MNQRTEVTEEDITELSDEFSIDEKYIRNSLQNKRADQQYEKSVINKNTTDNNKNIDKIKKGIRFIQKCVYINPTIPDSAEVLNVNSPKDTNEIVIKTITEHPNINTEHEDNLENTTKKHKFDLSKSTDQEKIRNLLDTKNARDPSELEGETVPIKPSQDNYIHTDNGPTHWQENRFYKFNYKIDVKDSNMSHSDVFKKHIYRILMKLNCIERVDDDNSIRQGKFTINRNLKLYISLIFGVLGLLTSIYDILLIATVMFGLYTSNVIVSLMYGLYEVFTKNKNNRDRIKSKLIK